MLVIRMQRTGRKGHAQFRVVVQDSRRTPTSGRVVAQLGSLNPHTKEAVLNKEKAEFYLKNGAQPSPRVVRLLKSEGVKLPEWVEVPADKKREIRNSEKLRRNRPVEEKAEEAPAEETAPVEAETTEEVVETAEDAVVAEAEEATPVEAEAESEEKPAEPETAEAPAEEETKA